MSFTSFDSSKGVSTLGVNVFEVNVPGVDALGVASANDSRVMENAAKRGIFTRLRMIGGGPVSGVGHAPSGRSVGFPRNSFAIQLVCGGSSAKASDMLANANREKRGS